MRGGSLGEVVAHEGSTALVHKELSDHLPVKFGVFSF